MSEATSEQEVYDQLSLYTLSNTDSRFIHQHIVDAYAAQHAEDNSKPIKTTFALIGLYLALEKNYTGKEVQRAHMRLAAHRKDWPHFEAPPEKGETNVFDVMRTQPGIERDQAIMEWCACVWETWSAMHQTVADLVRAELGDI